MTSRATPPAASRIRRPKLLSLLLLPLALLGCGPSDTPGIRFAELTGGNVVVIDVRSVGCFHETRSRFRLSVDDTDTPRVRGWWRDAPAFWWGRERFDGAVSRADLAALDTLFDHYRSQSGGYECTMEERITVERRRGGRVRQRERFVDSTCPRGIRGEARALDEILGEVMYASYQDE